MNGPEHAQCVNWSVSFTLHMLHTSVSQIMVHGPPEVLGNCPYGPSIYTVEKIKFK